MEINMERTLVSEANRKIGETVMVQGWVDGRRDHGKIIFIDLRDRSGLLQVVFTPLERHQLVPEAQTEIINQGVTHPSAGREAPVLTGFTPADKNIYLSATGLRDEWVVEIEGRVAERPKGMQNLELPTGTVELQATVLKILNEAKTPPIPVHGDGYEIDEELRLKYRDLDLRRERMQKNIRLRHKVTTLVRDYFNERGFVEIETPLLTKTSPEGARDFVVPSRLQPGKFYALPQAPQQYKQLLMIAGFERYFKIARALRDEDLRGDRQLEHTQIDMEMSFATQRDVLDMVEGLMIFVTESLGKDRKST